MKKEQFLEHERYCSIFLSKDGKAFLSLDEGEREVTEEPVLKFLNHKLFLEDGYTLANLFKYLAPHQHLDLVYGSQGYMSYMEAYKNIVASNLITFPPENKTLYLKYMLIYSMGEPSYQKKIKEEIEKNIRDITPKKVKVKFAGDDGSWESFMKESDDRRRREITKALKENSYEAYCRENAESYDSMDVSVLAPNENKNEDNPEDMIYYSCTGQKFSEMLQMPIKVGDAIVYEEDVNKTIELINYLSITLNMLVEAIFHELSWESVESREEGILMEELRGKAEAAKEQFLLDKKD